MNTSNWHNSLWPSDAYTEKLHFEDILPKGPYLPCVSMAGRALLAGYPWFVIMPTLPSLEAPEVVIMTTSGVSNDDKVDILTTLRFSVNSLDTMQSAYNKVFFFPENTRHRHYIACLWLVHWEYKFWFQSNTVYNIIMIYWFMLQKVPTVYGYHFYIKNKY